MGAQPNSPPHFGTLVVDCLAFSLGQRLKPKKDHVEVFFEVVDTAPSETIIIDDIQYQTSLRESRKSDEYLNDYMDLFEYLKSQTNVPYKVRRQAEFNSQTNISRIVKKIMPIEIKLQVF